MLVISEQDMMENYIMKDAISDLKKGIKAKKEKLILNPERTVINFPEQEGSALYMPSANLHESKASVKVVTILPKNPQFGKATTQAVLLFSEAETGKHLCLMTASLPTTLSPGALRGVPSEVFARHESSKLAVIATGAMAFEQVLGVLEVRSLST